MPTLPCGCKIVRATASCPEERWLCPKCEIALADEMAREEEIQSQVMRAEAIYDERRGH